MDTPFDTITTYITYASSEEEFDEQKKLIKYALSELVPYIAPYVFYSLVDNLSYEDICAKNYLYIGKGDFYGHRRQGMAAIKRWMILYGNWEM